MLPSPRFTSIRKNMMDQNGEAGKWVMASVKAMKAKPVPWTAWWRREDDMCFIMNLFPFLMLLL